MHWRPWDFIQFLNVLVQRDRRRMYLNTNTLGFLQIFSVKYKKCQYSTVTVNPPEWVLEFDTSPPKRTLQDLLFSGCQAHMMIAMRLQRLIRICIKPRTSWTIDTQTGVGGAIEITSHTNLCSWFISPDTNILFLSSLCFHSVTIKRKKNSNVSEHALKLVPPTCPCRWHSDRLPHQFYLQWVSISWPMAAQTERSLLSLCCCHAALP